MLVLFLDKRDDKRIISYLCEYKTETMSESYNPDWRYAKMSQTEIEDRVKARSSVLLSARHIIPESSGKKIKFSVTVKDIEHLVADALHRAKGVLYISDISNLPRYFGEAKYIQSANEIKKHQKGVKFHYYEINISGRRMYLNIKVDRNKKKTTLYSITSEIKMPSSQKENGIVG